MLLWVALYRHFQRNKGTITLVSLSIQFKLEGCYGKIHVTILGNRGSKYSAYAWTCRQMVLCIINLQLSSIIKHSYKETLEMLIDNWSSAQGRATPQISTSPNFSTLSPANMWYADDKIMNIMVIFYDPVLGNEILGEQHLIK